ncbi:hypothetical protein GW932_03825 [archaeon]|nr:hypothetical protein [archaeon]
MFKNRNQEIQDLHKRGKTFQELAGVFGLTRSRIWQICSSHDKPIFHCKKHNRNYTKECPFCKIDSYYTEVLRKNGDIKVEIEKLRLKNRNAENVRKRKILVTKLRDEFNFSFRKIGQLLDRHYSSIIYLYDNYKQEKVGKNKN